MDNGWIKLHRKITSWEWYKDDMVFRVFMHLLLNANHEENRWLGRIIYPGQRVTSYAHLAEELNIGVQSVRTALNRLKSTGEITVLKTNKYSLITMLKWKDYQSKTDKLTNNQQTTNKQLTTNKNDKNDKNKEGEETPPEEPEITPSEEARKFFEGNDPTIFQDFLKSTEADEFKLRNEFSNFILYWTEKNGVGKKQRWQMQETFEVRRRLVTWLNRSNQFNKLKATGRGLA